MKAVSICVPVMLALGGCGNNVPTTEGTSAKGETASDTQQEKLNKQKLTIEQAAEEATKVIEADAKAEIDAATPASNVAGQ